MKRIPLYIKLLFASLVLGALVVSCQKDSLETVAEPEADYVLPADFDGIFTEDELAEFDECPTMMMLKQERNNHGVWHRVTMQYTVEQVMLPFVDDCASPTPCPGCMNPNEWLGLMIEGAGPGTWYGKGAVQIGVNGVQCFADGSLNFVGWMEYEGSKAFGHLTNLRIVQEQDGSVFEVLRGDIYDGTERFKGAQGYILHRIHADHALQPFQPRTLTGYAIGWLYY